MTSEAAWRHVLDQASAPYRPAGMFAWQFARGKLGRDPVFRALLEQGLVPPGARVLDIGCGQGLLASLLATCDALVTQDQWPSSWASAPTDTRYTGIELMARDVARAQAAVIAMSTPPRYICADMRSAALPPCDVVVILDVLHYVDHAAQDALLRRVHTALAPQGRLLLRVGDASSAWGFAVSQWVDRWVTRVRGHRAAPTHGRSLVQWQTALARCGFTVRAQSMSQGTPFANVLLIGDKAKDGV